MPLKVIPVIDLLGGVVVRGVAGQREAYRPVESCLTESAAPEAIAAALQGKFHATEVYVADLDAIMHGRLSEEAYRQIAHTGMNLLLDAGLANLAAARRLHGLCESLPCQVQLVIGLESLHSLAHLAQMVEQLGPEQLVFSLDLVSGQPRTIAPELEGLPPEEIARGVIELGIPRLIVLDVAQVGTGQGLTTLPLCRELHGRHPQVSLISGGGVRSTNDLLALAHVGCQGALIASALHNGSLTAEAIAAI